MKRKHLVATVLLLGLWLAVYHPLIFVGLGMSALIYWAEQEAE